MKIDREKYSFITHEDAKEFVNQLKPIEIESFWKVILETDVMQEKIGKQDREVKLLMSDVEERIIDLKDAYNEYEYQVKEFLKTLTNEQN